GEIDETQCTDHARRSGAHRDRALCRPRDGLGRGDHQGARRLWRSFVTALWPGLVPMRPAPTVLSLPVRKVELMPPRTLRCSIGREVASWTSGWLVMRRSAALP